MNQILFILGSILTSSWCLDTSKYARILQSDFENTGTGPYRFKFETSDGISREEEGTLSNVNSVEGPAVIVRGSYSYTDNSGQVYNVRYTADENGFHPEGDHIKVPPFVPWVKHQHHDHDNINDEGINPTTKFYLPSTPSPPSNRYIPSTPAPPYIPKSSNQFRNLDPRVQDSIINILSNNGQGQGISIESVNALQ